MWNNSMANKDMAHIGNEALVHRVTSSERALTANIHADCHMLVRLTLLIHRVRGAHLWYSEVLHTIDFGVGWRGTDTKTRISILKIITLYSGGGYIVAHPRTKSTHPHYKISGVSSAGPALFRGWDSLISADPALLTSDGEFSVGYLCLHPFTVV